MPVVAGNSGGAPEAIVPGRTGFVSHDHKSLDEALRTLLEDPSRAAEMGGTGRDWVVENHTWPAVADRISSAITAVLGT